MPENKQLGQEIWRITQIIIQIGLLSIVIYYALRFMRGTRSAIILVGITIITSLGWVISHFLNLQVFEWMFSQVPALLTFALIILFQPELRRAFAEIGSNPRRLFGTHAVLNDSIDCIIDTVFQLGSKKIGALIILEREIPMRALVETGVPVNAPLTKELLITIFYKNTPLHDGAVIIKDNVIVAASCYISSLSQSSLSKDLGTRHRAGVGVTEDYDALAVIVSEETGNVSLSNGGLLARDINKTNLRRHLTNYLIKNKDKNLSDRLEKRKEGEDAEKDIT
ncbi:MAG: TIGR00159 family protein [Lentisphaeria bacterium]|nr:diadenylate cyclase CdaA [Lentisphaeria bacterium]NQZ68590.1 TIGR00159 family protein [Lentisphaeria bacterium]